MGKEDKLKGEVPVAFVILQNDRDDQSKILKAIQDEVRKKVGAFAKLE